MIASALPSAQSREDRRIGGGGHGREQVVSGAPSCGRPESPRDPTAGSFRWQVLA